MIAFDNKLYFEKQAEAIRERIIKASPGRLYLEVGGKLFYDSHASRVLPGFDPKIKAKIINSLKADIEIIFCVNYPDIIADRHIKTPEDSYLDVCLESLNEIEDYFGIRPLISVNRVKQDKMHEDKFLYFVNSFISKGYKLFYRFEIIGYPNEIDKVLSKWGFLNDDYIPVSKPLVIVTGSASSSGKLSTALGQVYLDNVVYKLPSAYAKYELFPIWNLSVDHPVNLAYEAATADIGDYNLLDKYHKDSYGIDSTNYNRDIEAFDLLTEIINRLSAENIMHSYKSPTDMGINEAGFSILDDATVQRASVDEIKLRINRYEEEVNLGSLSPQVVDRCRGLLDRV